MVEVEPIGLRRAAGSHEYGVGFHDGGLSLAFIDHPLVVDLFHRCLHDECHAPSGDGLAQSFGHVAVEHGQTFLQVFYHCHFAAKAAEYGGELHADDSSPHDAEAGGDMVDVEQFGRSDYLRTVDARDGQHL